MLGYLSLDIICSSKLTVFLELRSRKTVRFSEQKMSADKYPSIFSRQMKAIVYISRIYGLIMDLHNDLLPVGPIAQLVEHVIRIAEVGVKVPFRPFFCYCLRTVPTIVIAHTFCASPDTRISYRQCLLIQGYSCAV